MTMQSKATSLNVNLSDLILDQNNPRFAELYGGDGTEDDLIDYLLYTEAAEDVAKAIVTAEEFYPDRPLWVIRSGERYLVKDGNRRCAAVKALQTPGTFKLGLPRTQIVTLPVLVYDRQEDIDKRIVEEHAGNLFRKWERIAKSLEVMRLAESGRYNETLDLDSRPGDLIKLASFYREAVQYVGNDLRQLLRRGRGDTGGKTIIFERLFNQSSLCGYTFERGPSYKIRVLDPHRFSSYVIALVRYLLDNPKTTTDFVDAENRKGSFLSTLLAYGFDYREGYRPSVVGGETDTVSGTHTSGNRDQLASQLTRSSSSETDDNSHPVDSPNRNDNLPNNSPSATATAQMGVVSSRGSIRRSPAIKRKGVPPGLILRIREYYKIDSSSYPNAKVAMARVTFECVLKFVVESTKINGRTLLSKTPCFSAAYARKPYTNFEKMKEAFTGLIINARAKGAFESFDLSHNHTIIHNYSVNADPILANTMSANLMPLIEFMLQDEADLLSSIDLNKF